LREAINSFLIKSRGHWPGFAGGVPGVAAEKNREASTVVGRETGYFLEGSAGNDSSESARAIQVKRTQAMRHSAVR